MTVGLENITVNDSRPTPEATCCATQLTEIPRTGKCRDGRQTSGAGLEEGKDVAAGGVQGLPWGVEMLWN